MFGAIYLDIIPYLEQGTITVNDIYKAFDNASKSICSLGTYSITHANNSNIEINEDSIFFLNLVLQIEAYIFKVDDDAGFSMREIIEAVIESKAQIKSVLHDAIRGRDRYPEFGFGMMIPQTIRSALSNKRIADSINDFCFKEKPTIEKSEKFINDIFSDNSLNPKDQILNKYKNMYDKSVALRRKQIDIITKNAKTHLAELERSVNPSIILTAISKERDELQSDLKHSQNILKIENDAVEELKRFLDYNELAEVEEFKKRISAKMVSEMGIEIPDEKILELKLQEALKSHEVYSKKSSINIISILLLSANTIISFMLLLAAIGFEDYGPYVAIRIITVLLNIGIIVLLLTLSSTKKYRIADGKETLTTLYGVYCLFVGIILAFVSQPREGWIITDIFLFVGYIVFSIIIYINKPIDFSS